MSEVSVPPTTPSLIRACSITSTTGGVNPDTIPGEPGDTQSSLSKVQTALFTIQRRTTGPTDSAHQPTSFSQSTTVPAPTTNAPSNTMTAPGDSRAQEVPTHRYAQFPPFNDQRGDRQDVKTRFDKEWASLQSKEACAV